MTTAWALIKTIPLAAIVGVAFLAGWIASLLITVIDASLCVIVLRQVAERWGLDAPSTTLMVASVVALWAVLGAQLDGADRKRIARIAAHLGMKDEEDAYGMDSIIHTISRWVGLSLLGLGLRYLPW